MTGKVKRYRTAQVVPALTPGPLAVGATCVCCARSDAGCDCAPFAFCRQCRRCPVHCVCFPAERTAQKVAACVVAVILATSLLGCGPEARQSAQVAPTPGPPATVGVSEGHLITSRMYDTYCGGQDDLARVVLTTDCAHRDKWDVPPAPRFPYQAPNSVTPGPCRVCGAP